VESDLPIAPSEPLVPRIPSSDLGFQHPARNQSKKKGKKSPGNLTLRGSTILSFRLPCLSEASPNRKHGLVVGTSRVMSVNGCAVLLTANHEVHHRSERGDLAIFGTRMYCR
jgi:hypothetical protein